MTLPVEPNIELTVRLKLENGSCFLNDSLTFLLPATDFVVDDLLAKEGQRLITDCLFRKIVLSGSITNTEVFVFS